MKSVECGSFEEWKETVKELLRENVHPFDVQWLERTGEAPFRKLKNLFSKPPAHSPKMYRIARPVLESAELISCHKNFKKWDLLYQIAWRSINGEKHLLEAADDPVVLRLVAMAKQVKRDIRNMKCRVQFHAASNEKNAEHVCWYEPEHLILKRVAPFFQSYFEDVRWHLYTPQGSVSWDLKELTFGAAPNLTTEVDENLMTAAAKQLIFKPLEAGLKWIVDNNPFSGLDSLTANAREAKVPVAAFPEHRDLCA